MTGQGLDPDDVWTRQYVREDLWDNVWGNRSVDDVRSILESGDPLDQPEEVQDHLVAMTAWLSDCETVVDVGCGPMHYVVPDGTVGVDVSPHQLELADELHPDVETYECSALDLPFDDGAFDGSRSSGLIRHVEDWQTVLGEILRVASDRSSFTLLVSTPNHSPGKCGRYQWCQDLEDVREFVAPHEIVNETTRKTWAEFESIRFDVRLEAE